VSLNFSAPPPRVSAAVVDPSPPVKDWTPRPFSLIFGIARSLTSSCYRRSSSPTPVVAAPRAHRSAARAAAIVEPLCCRLFSAREPAYFLCTRLAISPTQFLFSSCTAAYPQARRSGRSTPFRCRPPVRHNRSRRPPCHSRKSPRVVLHLHVVEMVAGNAVQGQRRQAPAARRRTPASPPPPLLARDLSRPICDVWTGSRTPSF
jgi:hypothetical protein